MNTSREKTSRAAQGPSRPTRRWWEEPGAALAHLLLVLSLAGCGPVVLISPYDRVLDEGVSDVHTRLVAFASRMETASGRPEGTYASNQSFYTDVLASVSTLKIRVQAQPKSEISLKQLTELEANIERLRKLHELGGERGLRREISQPALVALDSNCTAIITLETAKRTGTKKD